MGASGARPRLHVPEKNPLRVKVNRQWPSRLAALIAPGVDAAMSSRRF